MTFSKEINNFDPGYLCVLDPRCGRGDGEHSVVCNQMNVDREEKLWENERASRLERFRNLGINHP